MTLKRNTLGFLVKESYLSGVARITSLQFGPLFLKYQKQMLRLTLEKGLSYQCKNSSGSKTLAFLTNKAVGEKGPKFGPPLPYQPMPKSTHSFFRYPFLSPHILEKMLEIAFAKIYLYP